jgi:hypothetical protein
MSEPEQVRDRAGRLCLTKYTPMASNRRGEERPKHYQHSFQGGPAISPGGEWIVDNVWVWHPLGIVTAWSLRHWLGDDPWESEDEPSKWSLRP